uniref:Coiled-coil alpha-helical rod protein 1 n=1 Tax=Pelusios castaneus TaxID=367368 RepID=A0A8C8S3F9_9SAUR
AISPIGPRGLIPPSHFESRSAPPLTASGTGPWKAGPLCWQLQELSELREENQCLRDELRRWTVGGAKTLRGRVGAEREEPGPPAAHHALAVSQQAELISHQLHEIQRLEAELAGLRVAALQQEAKVATRDSTVACLQGELEQLRGRSQAEGEALRVELEEQKRCGQAEANALKAELEELRRRGQAESEALRAELASQQALLQQLRTYVGEQGNGLGPETQQLQDQVQVKRLEGERDALRTTVELLQLRLASLSDILALQELELTKTPHDPLQPEPAQKSRALLGRWREKVFALMVQLRSQELGHVDATSSLQRKVSELQCEVESRDQKVALLLHTLQDKSAEADVERVNNKVRCGPVAPLGGLALIQLRDRAPAGTDTLLPRRLGLSGYSRGGLATRTHAWGPTDSLSPFFSPSPSPEALQAELALLHQERDQLVAELKKGAQILEQQVAEAREKGTWATWSLQEALEQKEEVERQQQQLQGQLEEAQRALQESREEAAGLREELARLRDEYERALQDKVTEVETRLHRDLAEMEQRLNGARREHTKAVVALRQTERQAARDKARSQELTRLQEEAKQEEVARLRSRLQALERDKNLLTVRATCQGALSCSAKPCWLETLATMLDDLQSLSTAILGEEEEEEMLAGEEGSTDGPH